MNNRKELIKRSNNIFGRTFRSNRVTEQIYCLQHNLRSTIARQQQSKSRRFY